MSKIKSTTVSMKISIKTNKYVTNYKAYRKHTLEIERH